ncbi:MAG: response regulator, partial [Treponemataceae bacterium]|nr:response regulator [Treponemataceae bacterium]
MKQDGNKFQLYFIGNLGEINQAYEIIGKNYVKHAFERPVDTEALFKTLKHNGGDYTLTEKVYKYKIDPDKLTILVIDDEVIQLHAMERWLQKNYNVLTEKSGTDGIALLKQYKVDMILLDYEMPILSGFEVFQLLKSDPETEKIPIVFLTANSDSDIVRQVVELKPAGYLLKNTSPVILLQRIDEIFAKIFGA